MAGRRKKPRLFSFAREVELGNLSEVAADPEDRAAIESLVDAFVEICRAQQVTAETMAAVARAARHRSAYVRGAGITRLTVMAHYFPEAVAVLREVARDPDDEVRLYACAALPNTPDEVALPLVAQALEDEAWRVRKAAAQAATALLAPGLLDVLERRIGAEPDARVKVVLQLAADHQRRSAAG